MIKSFLKNNYEIISLVLFSLALPTNITFKLVKTRISVLAAFASNIILFSRLLFRLNYCCYSYFRGFGF